ncbi:50S ribosomal protein L25 [Candidatus Propionivibrio aalborgensis]|uniref:Large ribosomal subunit protein bL25 n=1 Tax=Candidatus Propionivibrio aalborgensis TaxID=1860101 RepID=A0A1A8XNG3_9RHOO|nr:50S ribosomal protein L25/general stress protein Ctc [Candidatus Propionivibrio aalborgensis]SBT06186.1 50S ribosomal protein L25 [Candidatus Propionivibrio aalborgensis]
MKFELNAQKRTLQGSGASRRLRRANKVPGIVYGGTAVPTLIEIEHNDLLLSLRKEAFHSSVLTIKIDGVAESVLLRDSQMHPYKPLVQHVDFLRVDATHAIHQRVPLHFLNAEVSPGVKLAGGNVSPAMNDIEVSCLPQDLPPFIEVDLKDMEVGQSFHLSQIVFPKGVAPTAHTGDDPVVVTISAKKAEVVEEGEGEREGEGEGEAATPAA